MAIEDYHNVTYAAATTGEQAMLQINKNHRVSSVVVGSGGDSYDIQYQLVNGGTRYTVAATQSGTTIQNFANPITAIGLDITTNGSGITFEVRTALRGA